MKAWLGNPLRGKDTIEVFSFPWWKHFPIVMSFYFQNVFEMVVKCSGSDRTRWARSLEVFWAHSWVFLLFHWIAKKALLLGVLLGDAAWGAEEGVLVFLPLLVGFKSTFL